MKGEGSREPENSGLGKKELPSSAVLIKHCWGLQRNCGRAAAAWGMELQNRGSEPKE